MHRPGQALPERRPLTNHDVILRQAHFENRRPAPFGEHEKRVGVSQLLGAFGNNDFSEYFASYADASFIFSYPQS